MIRKTIAALLILMLTTVGTVSADSDLEGAVASLFFPREHSDYLQSLAQQRAVDISTDFSHNGWPTNAGGEVIAWNKTGAADAAQQWLQSPAHAAILSGPWSSIGCGSYTVNGAYYAVCLVGDSGDGGSGIAQQIVTVPAPTQAPVALPDTALHAP